jgi:hypothetical protein
VIELNRRERLERCYSHDETDRPAVYVRTGFPADDPTYDEMKSYLNAHTELKAFWSGADISPYPTETRAEPYSEDFERRVTVLHTPKGDLQSSRLVSLKGRPGLDETYYIKEPSEAEAYLSLPLPEIGEVDVSSFRTVVEDTGDRGIVSVPLGVSPGGSVVGLFGTWTFAKATITHRDLIHELCRRQMDIAMGRLEKLLENDIGPYFQMSGEEFIVPPIHGPRDFQDFIVKYEKPIFDRIHSAGGFVHVHSHGSIKRVLPGFIEMGVDVLHPFEAPPMGDTTPAEAKEIVGGKICMEGNIQINRMYEASPGEITRETEELIETVFYDHKDLIVCPTASPYVRGMGREAFPQFKAMIDAVLNWMG